MLTQKNNKVKNLGKKIGFVAGYFLFTTILFLVLKFFKKLPDKWTYLHIMGITLIVVIVGTIMRKKLK